MSAEDSPHIPQPEDPFSEDFGDVNALMAECGIQAPEGADRVSEEPVNPHNVEGSVRAVNATVDSVRAATESEIAEPVTLDSITQGSPYEMTGFLVEADEHGPMAPEQVRQFAGALLCRTTIANIKIPSKDQDAVNRLAAATPLKNVRSNVRRGMHRAGFDPTAADDANQAIAELVANVRDNVEAAQGVDPFQHAGRLVVEVFRNPLTGDSTLLAQTINASAQTLEGRIKKAAAVGGLGLQVIHETSDNMGTYHIAPEDYGAQQGITLTKEKDADPIDTMQIKALDPEIIDNNAQSAGEKEIGLRAVWFTLSTQKSNSTSAPRTPSPAPVNA